VITALFRCVGKQSKETEDGIAWTINLERSVGLPVLTTKIKTTSRAEAEHFVEGKYYHIPIKEDHEMSGLFAGMSLDRRLAGCKHHAILSGTGFPGRVCLDCGEVLPADFVPEPENEEEEV
jgi:hypothetical protein